jgi:hypothetical protein
MSAPEILYQAHLLIAELIGLLLTCIAGYRLILEELKPLRRKKSPRQIKPEHPFGAEGSNSEKAQEGTNVAADAPGSR